MRLLEHLTGKTLAASGESNIDIVVNALCHMSSETVGLYFRLQKQIEYPMRKMLFNFKEKEFYKKPLEQVDLRSVIIEHFADSPILVAITHILTQEKSTLVQYGKFLVDWQEFVPSSKHQTLDDLQGAFTEIKERLIKHLIFNDLFQLGVVEKMTEQ